MHAAIHLEWPSVEFASTFDVYRNGLYVYSGPALNGPSTNSYEELNQGTDDEAIEFRVVAKNGAGTSVSNSITLTAVASVCATSPPVAILSGTVACGTAANIPLVALQWTTVDGAAGWKIYRNGLPFAVAKFRDFVDTALRHAHDFRL
jgi:hypothetical protein